jgi:6-pyruvoyltetrahydropterin/6-carboxytetrahydropterin synthase
MNKIYLYGEKEFNAARKLKIIPGDHPSNRLHGHTFTGGIKIKLEDNSNYSLSSLKEELSAVIDPMDFSYLNDQIENPSDLVLANELFKSYRYKNLITSYISSSSSQGASYEGPENNYVWKKFSFQASHKLPNVPKGHKCGNMHGHTFKVILNAKASVESDRDLFDLNLISNSLFLELNKKCLNNIVGLENPTSELIASWIYSKLKSSNDFISKVEVMETDHAGCSFDGENYRIWRDQKLESAISYKSYEETYGFGYISRLYVESPLDKVLGWLMDFGDVKEIFKPVFLRMDHHNLNELDNLSNPSIVSLVEWMGVQLIPALPELSGIGLYESEGNGAELIINKERR